MPAAPSWFSGPDYFAAFPSLHSAYTITCCCFLSRVDFRLGMVGARLAGATLFSTLYLGQHYAIDLMGGAAYSLVPCWIAERMG